MDKGHIQSDHISISDQKKEIKDPVGIASIDDAIHFLSKWLPPITPEDKILFMNAMSDTNTTFGTHCIRKYVECINPYLPTISTGRDGKPREPDCLASGIIFFYGSLIYIMHFPGWGNHIEDIIIYNILYILVDHYIDDMKIDDQIKQQAIAQMSILILDPLKAYNMDLIDPTFKMIASLYHKLITRCPSAKHSIMKLFYAEIEGLHIQKDNKFQRQQYYDIAGKKGGYSLQVLQDIVGNTDKNITIATYNLGVLTQLVDDMMDVNADINNGIHTIATHDLAVDGNLDKLWIDIVDNIANIDPCFVIFIIIYSGCAIYIPDRAKNNYTPTLLSKTNPMNIFEYDRGFDASRMLVEWVTNEIIANEILKHT